MKQRFVAPLLLGLWPSLAWAAPVADALAPAKASDVKIEGYLGEKMDSCLKQRVMAQAIEKVVKPFRDKTEVGDGDWRCEYWGKWFTSAALAYAWQPNTENRAVIDKAVAELLKTPAPDGYIGTRAPQHRLKGWDVWGRKYVLLGLLNYYDLTGDKAVLDAAKRHADTLLNETGPGKANIAGIGYADWKGLPPSSVLEPMVVLYRRTGEQKYLDYANYIVGQWSQPSVYLPNGLRLVEKALDKTPVAQINTPKAYEMTSCYEGLCELYRETGDVRYLQAVKNIGQSISDSELFIVGSGSSRELWFGGRNKQTQSNADPMETCVTATWMKFCYQLLRLTGDARWADEMEISLYNALLGVLKPDGTWWAYYTPLNGAKKPSHEQHRDVALSCCVCSGPRAFYLTPLWAVMADKDGPVVNLYNRGSATVTLATGNRVTLLQDTDYPAGEQINLTVQPEKSAEFTLKLRVPQWSEKTAIAVNGKPAPVDLKPGNYAALRRQWKAGDRVQLTLDLRGRAVSDPGGSGKVALLRGPLVLAQDRRLPGENAGLSFVADATHRVALSPATPPPGVWMAFNAPAVDGSGKQAQVALCDWASAGNTWGQDSAYKTWMAQPLEDFARGGLEGAQWIWFGGDAGELSGAVDQPWPVGTRYFRKAIELPAGFAAKQARLSLTADDEWTLWLNGEKLGEGSRWQEVKTFDVKARLKPGRNVLAVEVKNTSPSPAGLIVSFDIVPQSGPALRVISDASWKSAAAAAENWQSAEFDDAAWQGARVLGALGVKPWGAIAPE